MTTRRRTGGRTARRAAIASVALVSWAHGTPAALASFAKSTTATTTVSAHQMGIPALSCGALAIGSATLSWTAPADTTVVDVYGSGFLASSSYELAFGTAAGGPYNTVKTVSALLSAELLSSGDRYYVVRTTKLSWKGPNSNEKHVAAVLGLVATCS